MKKMLFLFLTVCPQLLLRAQQPVDYVNPQIGGISHLLQPTFNTVHLPHGMVRFTPVKSPGISDHYVALRIFGLPLNQPAHRFPPVVTIMPGMGQPTADPDALASEYDHDFETVRPYYYSVLLEDEEILAEFTPTERCGFYRFSMKNGPFFMVLKGDREADMKIIDNNTIMASATLNGLRQYAYLKFNQPFTESGAIEKNTLKNGRKSIAGDDTGLFVTFSGNGSEPLMLKYGISYIDGDQAKRTLDEQVRGWDFDKIKENGREIWNEAFEQIEVRGGTEDDKVVFYTAVYRTKERMVNINEDGRYYSAYDRQVHHDDRPFYIDDWSWDTYRTSHPLMVILDPAREADIIQSYVRMYEQSGWMPSFPQAYGDMGGMIGHHQAAIISDAWHKGVRGFDIGKAYEGLMKNAMKGTMVPWREGPATELDDFYRKNGWFPALAPGEKETVAAVHPFEKRQAVAVTLEHSYDDWCLSRLASSLGHQDDAKLLMAKAFNYKNVYNPANGFMSPKKADGSWVTPFDPKKDRGPGCRDYFAEINTYTYTFSVQHDVAGLMELMGGREDFIKRLDGLFEEPMYGYCRWTQTADIPDGTGMVGQFVMGNEQGFHVPYLYVYAGAPWKTQKRIRNLMKTWFRNDLMGVCGDEDGGAMSAFYIFSALGFYPVTPGMPVYVIGTPLSEKAVVHLPNGKKFTIRVINNSAQNKYIQSAKLNGKPLDKAWFTHDELMNGGELIFEMGPRPNKAWGTAEAPPSLNFHEK